MLCDYLEGWDGWGWEGGSRLGGGAGETLGLIYTYYQAGGKLLCSAGSSAWPSSELSDDLEGPYGQWGWEGGSGGREHIHTYG